LDTSQFVTVLTKEESDGYHFDRSSCGIAYWCSSKLAAQPKLGLLPERDHWVGSRNSFNSFVVRPYLACFWIKTTAEQSSIVGFIAACGLKTDSVAGSVRPVKTESSEYALTY
jgi:hypothetical protein